MSNHMLKAVQSFSITPAALEWVNASSCRGIIAIVVEYVCVDETLESQDELSIAFHTVISTRIVEQSGLVLLLRERVSERLGGQQAQDTRNTSEQMVVDGISRSWTAARGASLLRQLLYRPRTCDRRETFLLGYEPTVIFASIARHIGS